MFHIFISKKCQKHSSRGTFSICKRTNKLRMESGGHGQENIKFLNRHKMPHQINAEFNNGVRLGNVTGHHQNRCRIGNKQCWFPDDWTRDDIKRAGKRVAGLKKNKKRFEQTPNTGYYKGVKVGLYSHHGFIETIFPWYHQKGGFKYDNR